MINGRKLAELPCVTIAIDGIGKYLLLAIPLQVIPPKCAALSIPGLAAPNNRLSATKITALRNVNFLVCSSRVSRSRTSVNNIPNYPKIAPNAPILIVAGCTKTLAMLPPRPQSR